MNKNYAQTRVESLKESIYNISSGFVLSLLVWIYLISPLFNIQKDMLENVKITFIFTIISIIRSFYWRRYFNYKHKKRWREKVEIRN